MLPYYHNVYALDYTIYTERVIAMSNEKIVALYQRLPTEKYQWWGKLDTHDVAEIFEQEAMRRKLPLPPR